MMNGKIYLIPVVAFYTLVCSIFGILAIDYNIRYIEYLEKSVYPMLAREINKSNLPPAIKNIMIDKLTSNDANIVLRDMCFRLNSKYKSISKKCIEYEKTINYFTIGFVIFFFLVFFGIILILP